MKNQPKYANIEKLKARLVAQRENFEKQLKEVKKRYPLVALAYGIQEATIAELSYSVSHDTIMGSIYISLTNAQIDLKTATDLRVKLVEARRKFDRCQGRARTDAETGGCIEAYVADIH